MLLRCADRELLATLNRNAEAYTYRTALSPGIMLVCRAAGKRELAEYTPKFARSGVVF
jgi:hypothetical protein